jgi:hypothetical protein
MNWVNGVLGSKQWIENLILFFGYGQSNIPLEVERIVHFTLRYEKKNSVVTLCDLTCLFQIVFSLLCLIKFHTQVFQYFLNLYPQWFDRRPFLNTFDELFRNSFCQAYVQYNYISSNIQLVFPIQINVYFLPIKYFTRSAYSKISPVFSFTISYKNINSTWAYPTLKSGYPTRPTLDSIKTGSCP